ncbi:MAG: TPM domain-containing protein [Deltaproteobacteria bacterium]|nr:TPM domain-containing protein [Deltaproteobacteria bacterium]
MNLRLSMYTFVMCASGMVVECPPALAQDIPGINGHMTDPDRRLSDADKKAIEDQLSGLQEETHVDIAGWVTHAADNQVEELGARAYRQWNIGKAWDNGVFFVIPATGRAHLIVDRARPELTAAEQARVLAADRPEAPLATRLNALADTAGSLVKAKVFHARPPGPKDGRRALAYGAGAVAMALGSGLFGRRKRRPSAGSSRREEVHRPLA